MKKENKLSRYRSLKKRDIYTFIDNVVRFGEVSSELELGEKLGYPQAGWEEIVADMANRKKSPDFLDDKIKKIFPDYDETWWSYKFCTNHNERNYLTSYGHEQLEEWQKGFKSRFTQALEHAVPSKAEFDNVHYKKKKEILKEANEFYETIARLKRRMPNVNVNWLLTGEGGILDTSSFPDPLKSHIKDVIRNQFYFQHSDLIALSAENILHLVRRQFLQKCTDKINGIVSEYPDSKHYIRTELKKMGFKEQVMGEPKEYCYWKNEDEFYYDQNKKLYIFKIEDWFEPKEIGTILRN